MNMHSPLTGGSAGLETNEKPTRAEAEAAARTLLRWADSGPVGTMGELLGTAAILSRPALSRDYAHDFAADPAYLAGLPDLQNGPDSLI